MTAVSRFEVRLRVPDPPALVWGRLTDLDGHAAAIPFTTVAPTGTRMRDGLEFVATTRLGPLGLRDQMRVELTAPPGELTPGRFVVTKAGPFAGRVDATVAAAGTGTELTWRQEIAPPWLPRPLHPVAAWVASLAYRVALRRLTASGASRHG